MIIDAELFRESGGFVEDYFIGQAASVDKSPQHPPFGVTPKANSFLQGALCLTIGGMFGLTLAQLFSWAWNIIYGFLIGVLLWIYFEIRNQSVVEEIKDTYVLGDEKNKKN